MVGVIGAMSVSRGQYPADVDMDMVYLVFSTVEEWIIEHELYFYTAMLMTQRLVECGVGPSGLA
jgi:hypothetical protein